MSTFTFDEAANTTLQTINANWVENVSGYTVTDGSGSAWSSASPNSFTDRYAWFANGQGDTQESEIDVLAHPAGTFVWCLAQKNAGQQGYRVWLPSSGVIELRRNGTYIGDASGTGVNPNTDNYTLKVTYNASTGVVKAFLNGVEKYSYTDGTPLTGGSPGFYLYGNGETTNRPKISRFTDNAASGPTITSVSTGTPREGASLTVNGTSFGASQGAGGVTINSIAQTVTNWTDTAVTVTVVLGTNKFGAAYNVILTDSSANVSNTYAGITGLLPANSGLSYVDVGTPNTTSAYRLTSSADLVSGDQIEYSNVGGLVTVNSDATFSAGPGVSSFNFRVWTSGSGYGSAATQLTAIGSGISDKWTIRPFNKRSGLGF